MNEYWPWWAGALALAVITVGYSWLVERPFGVSGAWDRVIHWRRERGQERADALWAGDEAALAAAMIQATEAEFGPGATSRGEEGPSAPGRRAARAPAGPVPVGFQAVLLMSIFAGGFLAALTSGRFRIRADMGEGFSRIVTDSSLIMVVVLFVGGLLVGFGARLAGGCSTGHGLSGCSRLQPASIVATAVFFTTAVVVSTLLWKVL